MCSLRRRVASVAALIASGVVLSGCVTARGGPERLFSISEEVAQARDVVLPIVVDKYNFAQTESDRMLARNEYIARRMYIIDVEYTEFETALTRERQEFGFITALTGQALTTAGTVFTPVNTIHTLNGLATGLNTSKGFYDSELLVSKTIQIVEGQMRAQRDDVATRIISRINKNESTITYPLSAALHDLEDYYRAGTLSAGLIKAATDAGNAAQDAATAKEAVMLQGGSFEANDTTTLRLQAFLAAPGDRKAKVALLETCLFKARGVHLPYKSIMFGANFKDLRTKVAACAGA